MAQQGRYMDSPKADPRQLEDEAYVLEHLGSTKELEDATWAKAKESIAKAKARRSVPHMQRVYYRKLHSHGASTQVTLPSPMLHALGWHTGDDVLVHMEGKTIIIE